MKIQTLDVARLREASWNPNRMDENMKANLRECIDQFSKVVPLVVRFLGNGVCEVLSGNHRLKVLRDVEQTRVSCVVVNLDDVDARLLSQALNHIHGEDDLGLRGELLRRVLADLDEGVVLSVLPETSETLQALTSLGQEDLAAHLQVWEAARSARLKHLQFQLTEPQLEIVHQALVLLMPGAREERGASPNVRGTALFLLCKEYLRKMAGSA